MKRIKYCLLLVIILMTACSTKTDDLNNLNISGKWMDILYDQPPLILFDYDKTGQKDQYSFDFVLYKFQFKENKKEYLRKLQYNKKGVALNISADKKRMIYLAEDLGIEDINLETGESRFIEMDGDLYSPQYVGKDKLSLIVNGDLYLYQQGLQGTILIDECEYTSDGWDTYAWLSEQDIIYVTAEKSGRYSLVKQNISTGKSTILMEKEDKIKFKLSNNKEKFIYQTQKEIFLYDGIKKTVSNVKLSDILPEGIKSICFSPDDSLIAFSYIYDDGSYLNSYEIWIMETNTNDAFKLYEKSRSSSAAIVW